MSSSRLQVLVPPGLDARVRKAAQRRGVSKGEWVRRALEDALKNDVRGPDALARLSSLGAPTADIDQMLADTDRARDLVRGGTPASMRDLVHAAVMLNNDVTKIASFDRGFDHVKGIERLALD